MDPIVEMAARFAYDLASRRVESGEHGPGGASFEPFVFLVPSINPRDGEPVGYPACVMVTSPDQDMLTRWANLFAVAVKARASIFTSEAWTADTKDGPNVAREVDAGTVRARADSCEAIVQVIATPEGVDVVRVIFKRTAEGVEWGECDWFEGEPGALPTFIPKGDIPEDVLKEAQRISLEMGLRVMPIAGRA